MSGYEVEHDNATGVEHAQKQEARRRPDLSTFFSTLDVVDTSGSRRPQNANSLPLPQDVSAAFRTLANAFSMMRGPETDRSADSNSELIGSLIESLMASADHPPSHVEGVPDEFIEQLERVPKKTLEKTPDTSCPICAQNFLDDRHPLVVRLPCHKDHLFDLECIQPWLKLHVTCPLCRLELIKKQEPPPKDEEEEEFDDMYA
ncbi:uncharacterized protein MYCFIDRAFT_62991 [Pseudocercospora fijiensis CIRAD86]|uniref:RING-type domain-containing protein n=1 Tax=Pseudocercospora fijiensis (strain CIRAD86) TaxID=383855 RepID=N1Q8Z7_PSEFD|nr:uncharacterized protein MYCFIDRAFT_62991 [Pseudocercospora fijiensis CIRAD86]EME89365.1 hypothetical protein MYCFIDRAFT_62991 [Pseudocercospora fijiensis CIRAD86]